MRKVYDLFVSGGRDSVTATTVAYDEARQQGVECRVVYINELKAFEVPEGLLPHNPLEYVRRFAEWLGVELVVIEPKFNYWEGVRRWGYPHLVKHRWCIHYLKKEPLTEFAMNEFREGLRPTWVTGIRRSESYIRRDRYVKKRYYYWVGDVLVEYYHPILDWSDDKVRKYIKERGIPENPLWSVGFSCECLCMAGTSAKQLDRMISMYPDLFMWLAEKDREVQKYAKEREMYVRPLCDLRIPLYKYVEEKLRQPTLEKFMNKNRM